MCVCSFALCFPWFVLCAGAGNSCSWWTVLTEPLDLLAVIWGGQVVDKYMPPNQKHTVWQVLLQAPCCPVK